MSNNHTIYLYFNTQHKTKQWYIKMDTNINEGFIPSHTMLNIDAWIDEKETRYFRKHLICTTQSKSSIDQKIDDVNISHVVIWNLIDLKRNTYKAEDYTPSEALKRAAALWLNSFRKQVTDEMRKMAKAIYLQYANSRNFVELQEKGKLFTSLDDLKHATRDLDTQLV